jgi:undecaprenyl-diphosphatase
VLGAREKLGGGWPGVKPDVHLLSAICVVFRCAASAAGAAYDAGVRRSLVYSTAAVLLSVAVILTAVGWADDPAKLPDWQALVLGLVQGLTELLPISSSGHLILTPWLFGWTYLQDNPSFNKTFDVALHLGTLVAVVAYFWHDLVRYLIAWFRSLHRRSIEGEDEKIAWVIVVASVPAAIIGAGLESAIEDKLGEPWQIAILLGVFAVVLWWADRRPERGDIAQVSLRQGLLLGLAQSLALAPGVSRSGITISAGRLLGLTRDAAARLSFLLVVPIVLGAVVLKGLKDVVFGDLPSGWVGPFVVGTVTAAGSGLLAIAWLLGYLRRHNYSLFVLYRLAAAVAILIAIATGARTAGF